ncbi:hypothetical protein O6H91_Y233400 [Diphasiastrum complanatum]|nr:hypothetical protein O6H91_Y233400 [Diphasiastrum complanatum]
MCGLDYFFSLVRSSVQAEEEEEEGDGADPRPSCDSKQGFGSAAPDVLHKVLLANGSRVAKPEGYLLLALHAVMLETGVVCVDSWGVAGSSEFFICGWNEKSEPLTLRYTLTELLEPSTAVEGASDHILEEITLTCKKSGDEFCAYGTVTGGEGSEEYSIRLPISQYVCDQSKAMRNNSKLGIQSDSNSIYSDPYGLWKEVKDGFSLPLLTVLCKRAGLQPPSSFLTLPLN